MSDVESNCMLSSESSSEDEGYTNYLTPDSEVDEPREKKAHADEVPEITCVETEELENIQQEGESVKEPAPGDLESSDPSSGDNSDGEQDLSKEDVASSDKSSTSGGRNQGSFPSHAGEDGQELDFKDCPAEAEESALLSDSEKDDMFEILEPETEDRSQMQQSEGQSQSESLQLNLGVQMGRNDSSSGTSDDETLDAELGKIGEELQQSSLGTVESKAKDQLFEDEDHDGDKKMQKSKEAKDHPFEEQNQTADDPQQAEKLRHEENVPQLVEKKPQPARKERQEMQKPTQEKPEAQQKPKVPKRPPSLSSTKRQNPLDVSTDSLGDNGVTGSLESSDRDAESDKTTVPSISKRRDIFEQMGTNGNPDQLQKPSVNKTKPRVSARPPSLSKTETPKARRKSTSDEETLSSESEESEKEFDVERKPLPSISKRLDIFERSVVEQKAGSPSKPKPAPKAKPKLSGKAGTRSLTHSQKSIASEAGEESTASSTNDKRNIEKEHLSSVSTTRNMFEHTDKEERHKKIQQPPITVSSKPKVHDGSPEKFGKKQAPTNKDMEHPEELTYSHGTEAPKILIISNNWFENYGSSDRHQHDTVKLEEMWWKFGGVTFTRQNLSKKEMRLAIDEFAGKTIKGNERYCAVFVLSLGKGDDEVIGVDGESISVDSILSEFKNTKRHLQNLPKFFIFQCCGGVEGTLLTERKEKQGLLLKPITDISDSVAFFTRPRNESEVNGHSRSYFTKDLVEIFEKYAESKDLLDLLTIVNNRISNRAANTEPNSGPSVGEIRSTFRKKLFIR